MRLAWTHSPTRKTKRSWSRRSRISENLRIRLSLQDLPETEPKSQRIRFSHKRSRVKETRTLKFLEQDPQKITQGKTVVQRAVLSQRRLT